MCSAVTTSFPMCSRPGGQLTGEECCANDDCKDYGRGRTCVCTGPMHSISSRCSDGQINSPCCVDHDCLSNKCGDHNACVAN